MLTMELEMPRVSNMPQRIWQALVENPGLTVSELAHTLGVSYQRIYSCLAHMTNVSEDDSDRLYPSLPDEADN